LKPNKDRLCHFHFFLVLKIAAFFMGGDVFRDVSKSLQQDMKWDFVNTLAVILPRVSFAAQSDDDAAAFAGVCWVAGDKSSGLAQKLCT
jgi:hypothetical protein